MVLCNLLSELDRTQSEHAVISLMDKGPLRSRLEALGVPVYSPRMTSARPNPAAWWRFLRLVRELKPDLLQGWMYHSNLAASWARAALRLRVPVAWSVHYTLNALDAEKPLTKLVIRLGAKFAGQADAIIFVSQTSRRQHAALGYNTQRAIVLPNGIDVREFRPSEEARQSVREELGLAKDSVLIGNIGRLHPMKDQANFLQSAALVAAKSPDANFLLAGRGVAPDTEALSNLIEKLGLRGRAHLLGERLDVARLAASLDVFMMSSAYGESFPNIVGEAMSCEVPCVVTDVGDCAWIVGDTGRVVAPQSPAPLAAQCLELLNLAPGKRQSLGAQARRRVIENFALESVAKHYASLYESFSGGKGR